MHQRKGWGLLLMLCICLIPYRSHADIDPQCFIFELSPSEGSGYYFHKNQTNDHRGRANWGRFVFVAGLKNYAEGVWAVNFVSNGYPRIGVGDMSFHGCPDFSNQHPGTGANGAHRYGRALDLRLISTQQGEAGEKTGIETGSEDYYSAATLFMIVGLIQTFGPENVEKVCLQDNHFLMGKQTKPLLSNPTILMISCDAHDNHVHIELKRSVN